MGTTEKLAQWIVATASEDIPEAAFAQARKSILDYIGTAIHGSTTDLGGMILDLTREQGGNPQARVIATNIRTATASAAFANGAMGHAADFDDLGGVGGHPATVLTPTTLALAEELHLSGRQLLTAWAVGYEVGTRLSANLHPERDWHPTAIFGTMAAAVAASKLMGLDVWKTRMALGIAGSQAAGLRRNFGTMTKPFHPGNAARGGIVAAKLASRGYTADPDIIEGRQGYADNFGGPKCNIPAMTQFLGHLYYLATEGTRIKPWPCCGGNHQTLTNLFDFLRREPIKPDQVASIEHIGPNVPCTGALLRDEVHEGLEGKFCLRYNISAAIIDGKVDLDTFGDARAERGDLQAFMARVRLVRNPDVAMRRPHIADGNPDAKLRIQMKDGRVHEIVFGTARHLTPDETVEKFRANAGLVLDRDRVGRCIELVGRLETVADVAAVLDTVTTGK
jgi:2-methylcitrate dehydratase PrpD